MIWIKISQIRYLFRHSLLRDSAYEMQMRKRLMELHLSAGEAYETLYAHDLAPCYGDFVHHVRWTFFSVLRYRIHGIGEIHTSLQ